LKQMNQCPPEMPKPKVVAAILFMLLAALCSNLFSPGALQAQDAYDLAKEIKVQGTIEKIGGPDGSQNAVGSHILVQTSQGVLDVHLGAGSRASAESLALSVGEQVTVIGMMQTMDSGDVLLARILTAGSRTTILRNSHGFPVQNVSKPSSGGSVLKGGL